MSLEKFARQQPADYPTVAIRKNGTISLNTVAVEQFNLKGALFATLHFDRKESLMGIRPTDEKDSSGFRVVQDKNRPLCNSMPVFLEILSNPI